MHFKSSWYGELRTVGSGPSHAKPETESLEPLDIDPVKGFTDWGDLGRPMWIWEA